MPTLRIQRPQFVSASAVRRSPTPIPRLTCYNSPMLYDDTIAAIATPSGEGGIGIVRVSGLDALAILRRMFAPARPGAFHPYRMRYGYVQDADGARVDEALAVYMRA